LNFNLVEKLRCPKNIEGTICRGKLQLDEGLFAAVYQKEDELSEALLHCDKCKTQYPIISGVAVVLDNIKSWLRENYYHILSGVHQNGGIGTGLAVWLESFGWELSNKPSNNYYEAPRWVNIFTATHYDMVPAGADDESDLGRFVASKKSVFDTVTEMLEAHVPVKLANALDVGTNVGGMAYRLAPFADDVIALDTAFNVVLTARQVQKGYPKKVSSYKRYMDGQYFEERFIEEMPDNTEFMVASAAPPPIDQCYDIITVLNVVDCVPYPEQFLKSLIDVLNPGGLLLVTSPYSWGSDDVPVDRWIGASEEVPSADAMLAIFSSQGLELIEERDNVPWVLREHKRWYRIFHNHCVLVRKPAS
jgi:SAM-dependent methyltransferase/uncharacterized protein YbaR (Trm112 family)